MYEAASIERVFENRINDLSLAAVCECGDKIAIVYSQFASLK